MKSPGTTLIISKKSRNHTELLCKYLNLPISIKNRKKYDEIKVKKVNKIKPLNYNIPSDISSSAFYVLTALNNNSELIIRNVNVNPSRIGIITILKKMGVKYFEKLEFTKEKKCDIKIKSPRTLKAINCLIFK